jgi:putative protease
MNHELLSPVGNMNMLLAAIHNGADAVYIGVPGFNARGRSADFTLLELKEMIDLAHLYGVKVNLAFNILIFEDELEDATQLIKDILPLSPDAFIVQDLGLCKIIREICPDIPIHASTQMTVTNYEAIKLLDDLNIKRFVLGRENSLDEIELIKKNTDKELEVFVHGALCVAYSGQCLTSEAMGGRSANRGQCAQSCRLDYDLIVDDKKIKINEKYLVSPKDLCGINEIPKLKEIGVTSFKIEGRLKSPEYVASTAHHYSHAIQNQIDPHAIEEMSLTYSRGFYSGWLHGVNHQDLVDGTFSAHRGLYIGKAKLIQQNSFRVKNHPLLINGNGVLLGFNINGIKNEVGGKIFNTKKFGDEIEVTLYNTNLKDVPEDAQVYINSEEKYFKELNQSYTTRQKQKRITLEFKINGKLNSPLEIEVSDGLHHKIFLSDKTLEPAQKMSLNSDIINEHLLSLGGSCYTGKIIKTNIENNLYLDFKELKKLKQEMIQFFNEARIKSKNYTINNYLISLDKKIPHKTQTKLNILLRSSTQVQDFVKNIKNHSLINFVMIDFEFGKDYAPSLELLRQHGFKVAIATNRILKPFEYYHLKLIERLKPDAILIRNLGALHYFQNKNFTLIGDFSLNVSNSLTANYLFEKSLSSLVLSYDLNLKQTNALMENTNANQLEITIHQHMPEFHMEHCVFAAFLSNGKSFRDCGKPCEKHEVELKDAYGNSHYLKADQECRNTMFAGSAQSAAKYLPEWQTRQLGYIRFEALNEKAHELTNKIQSYLDFLEGKIDLKALSLIVKALDKYGVTEGQLENFHSYKDRKKSKEATR